MWFTYHISSILKICNFSSILVCQNLQHAQLFCSTWMTSYVHIRKRGGQSTGTGILVKGWRITARVRRRKKKGKTMCTHSKWANEQTLYTFFKHLSFFTFLFLKFFCERQSSACSLTNFNRFCFDCHYFINNYFVNNNNVAIYLHK